jgi:chemotaxis protein MotB
MDSEPELRPRRSGKVATAILIVLCVVIAALAIYAFQARQTSNRLANAGQDCAGKLSACVSERDTEKKSVAQAEKSASETNASLSASLNASRAELDELRKQKEDADKRNAIFKAITEKLHALIGSGKLQVVMRHGRMIVKLPASVLFPSGSAELSKDGLVAVAEVAHILKQFPERQFEVAGHTDNIPVAPNSPFKNNLELSSARAVTVAEALEKGGMNGARLAAAGYSEFQPYASNAKETGRQENRRIEIVLVPNLSELSALDVDAGAP